MHAAEKKLLLTNSGDHDQTPHYVTSNLILLCLPCIPLRISRQQWVNLSHLANLCPEILAGDLCHYLALPYFRPFYCSMHGEGLGEIQTSLDDVSLKQC